LQRYATLILLCFLPSSLLQASDSIEHFSSQNDFESFKESENREFGQAREEFKLYKQQLLTAFDQYKNQASRIWGNKNAVSPGSKNWINYLNDMQHRSVVDFEKGTIDIEIAVDADQNMSDTEAQKQLQQTIISSLQQGSDKRSVLDMAKQPVSQPSGAAVLSGLVANRDGSEANDADYAQLAAQSMDSVKKKRIKGNDGKSRIIYRAQLQLVPDHIKKRALKYKSQIEINALEQKIPSAMILAIMETESMFNPTARSPAPAFGLMQLVPTSGARDAYKYLYNKDRIVSDTYLYKPENNIKLGAAFLNRLYYSYLAGIKNPVSRQWATIAAYNTGAGNVFRTFAGKYRKSRFGNHRKWKLAAYAEINKMSSDEVYAFLRKRLPYRETRKYMKKVSSRMKKYQPI